MFGKKQHHNLLRAKIFFGGHKTTNRARSVLIALALVFFVAAMLLLPFGLIARRVYDQAMSGKNDILAAEQAVESLDVDMAIRLVDSAADKFSTSRSELEKLRFLSFLPYVDERVQAADGLLHTGSAAAEALRQTLGAVRDIFSVVRDVEGLNGTLSSVLPDASMLFKDMTPDQKRRILAGLASGAPRIRAAVDQVDAAILSFDGLPQSPTVISLKAKIGPLRGKLATLRGKLVSILPAADILPGVLGYPDAKNYLLIFQNDTELRPTGGFLSMVGELTVRDAELAGTDLNDVYALDGPSEATVRPAPPAPIRKYIVIDKWYLRDANWSPDFTVAAGTIGKFYQEEYAAAHSGAAAPRIDGIIVVTPELATDILRVTGPITIDNKYKFDAANLVDELEFQVEKGFITAGIPFDQRKEIVGKLFREMISRVTSFSLAQLVGLVGDIHKNLAEGDILLWSQDQSLQKIILDNDWGGRLRDPRGDYLAVIDANLASLKTDPVVSRSIRYSLAPDGKGWFAGKAAVTYENRGKFTWKTTRYRTYTRVYVPDGTELLGVSGAMENDKLKDPAGHPGRADVGDELGRRYFGAFISIEPGEKKTLEFSFKLAPSVVKMIDGGAYLLDVDKQAGTSGRGLTLDLDFGKNLTAAEPAENTREFGDTKYRFSTDLDIDRHFEIGF